jgi:hypothetical protein
MDITLFPVIRGHNPNEIREPRKRPTKTDPNKISNPLPYEVPGLE